MSECTVIISIYTPRWLTRGTVFALGVIWFFDYRQRLGCGVLAFFYPYSGVLWVFFLYWFWDHFLSALILFLWCLRLPKCISFFCSCFHSPYSISIPHFCKFGLCGCGEGLSWFLRAFGDFLSEAHCITFPPWGFSGLCLRGVSLYAKCGIAKGLEF